MAVVCDLYIIRAPKINVFTDWLQSEIILGAISGVSGVLLSWNGKNGCRYDPVWESGNIKKKRICSCRSPQNRKAKESSNFYLPAGMVQAWDVTNRDPCTFQKTAGKARVRLAQTALSYHDVAQAGHCNVVLIISTIYVRPTNAELMSQQKTSIRLWCATNPSWSYRFFLHRVEDETDFQVSHREFWVMGISKIPLLLALPVAAEL